MNFTMTKPCANCPFRSDEVFPLHSGRVESILEGITHGDQTFSCHKTVDYSDRDESFDIEGDDHHIPSQDEQHCAGALILLEKLERPNQMMRIAERIGLYDRTKLDMEAPVYDSTEDMQDAIEEFWNERR